MRRHHATVSTLLLLLVGPGCGHHSVFQVGPQGNGGVPFLPIRTMAKTTTVYGQRWVELSVTGTFLTEPTLADKKKGVAPKEFTKTVVAFADRDGAAKIYGQFVQAPDLVKAWSVTGLQMAGEEAAGKLSALAPPQVPTASVSTLPVVSVVRARIQVPDDTPLYMNVDVPNGGTANASVELNENGTLSKASAEKQDQLPGAALTAVGTVASAALGSDALTALATHYFPAPATPNSVNGQTITKVDFQMTEVLRTYVVTEISSPGAEADCAKPENEIRCQRSVTITVQRGDAPKGAPDDSSKK
jgi:hypothetical protein